MIKFFNYILIGFTTILVFLVARYFFIGGDENYAYQIDNYYSFLFKRTLFCAIPGLILFGLLFLINKWKKQVNPLRVGLLGLTLCFVASLIGTLLFLNE